MRNPIRRFIRDESGANRIEYGLLAALACVGTLAALESLGVSMQRLYSFAGILLVVLLLTGSAAVGLLWYTRNKENKEES